MQIKVGLIHQTFWLESTDGNVQHGIHFVTHLVKERSKMYVFGHCNQDLVRYGPHTWPGPGPSRLTSGCCCVCAGLTGR